MKRFDTFEWALICMLIGLFVVGIFVALNRNDAKDMVSINQQPAAQHRLN